MKRLTFLLQLVIVSLILLLASCKDHGTGFPGGAGYKKVGEIKTIQQSNHA